MKNFLAAFFTIGGIVISAECSSQNECTKWYFGNYAGLDFITNPPTILNNSALYADEGCASMADANGNLLFYTNGVTVYNQLHTTMANGTGLFGNLSTTQGALIIQQPGSSTIYYLFTLDCQGWANGLRYSIVDMSLAAGMGSVTTKNVPLYVPSTEKLTATKHCNGTDVWVMTHDFNSLTFRAFLVTASGVSANPVLSPVGIVYANTDQAAQGYIKFSPNGKKLAAAARYSIQVCDFDNSTGLVSNPILLSNINTGWGCEFSPDNSLLYSCAFGQPYISQWNLCAGNSTAIIASQYTMASFGSNAMQLAPNGKIYVEAYGQSSLAVVNNPNLPGAACNFVVNGQSLGSAVTYFGLPNFNCSYFASTQPPMPFTYSVSCGTVSFATPSLCTNINYSISAMQWQFDDPPSGSANTSSMQAPQHSYFAAGTYSVKLVRHYQCFADSITLPVTVLSAAPSLSVSGTFSTCTNQSVTISGAGASSFTWLPSHSTNTSITFIPTSTSVYTLTAGSGTCTSSKLFTVTVSKCTGLGNFSSSSLFRIHPNPVDDELLINVAEKLDLMVTDMNGDLVFHADLDEGIHRIEFVNLKAGIYILKAVGINGVDVRKVMKME
jgi:PKD repeat protein